MTIIIHCKVFVEPTAVVATWLMTHALVPLLLHAAVEYQVVTMTHNPFVVIMTVITLEALSHLQQSSSLLLP